MHSPNNAILYTDTGIVNTIAYLDSIAEEQQQTFTYYTHTLNAVLCVLTRHVYIVYNRYSTQ